MAMALPQPPVVPGIITPVPGHPLTPTDVYNAEQHYFRIFTQRTQQVPGITDQTVRDARIFANEVLAAEAPGNVHPGAPIWAQQLMQQMTQVQQQMAQVQQQTAQLQQDTAQLQQQVTQNFNQLTTQFDRLEMRFIRLHNRSLAGGSVANPLEIVDVPDEFVEMNVRPNLLSQNAGGPLPLIDTHAALVGLSNDDVTQYVALYGVAATGICATDEVTLGQHLGVF
uniref:Uncharacterized protein n=1 Tax=Mycena chlorophos TaxID=658473 RepID=A0ABQ0L5M9_MYCCL|nr:predicted protein [Mycena chlorophos]